MDLGISNSNFYRLKDRLIFSTTPWRSMVPLEKWISSSWRDRDMAAEEVTRIRNIYLLADICQLGMDQQKVNVLAREYCDDIKRKNKPFILSHHMLPGPQQGQEKMSKSDPSSSIFMEDDEGEVNVKMKKAYCPPKIA